MSPSRCVSCQSEIKAGEMCSLGEDTLCLECFRLFQSDLSEVESDQLWKSLEEDTSFELIENPGRGNPTDSQILAQIGLEDSGLVVLKGSQERFIGRILQDASAHYAHIIEKRIEEGQEGMVKCELKLMQLLLKGRYARTEALVQAKIFKEKNQTSYIEALEELSILQSREVAIILCQETGYIGSIKRSLEIDEEGASLFPPSLMRVFQILPLSHSEDTFFLGMVNPLDQDIIDALEEILKIEITPVVIWETCIANTLGENFSLPEE